jgi:hypothetical protein
MENKSQEFIPEFMAASFLLEKTVESSGIIIEKFSKYFKDEKQQRALFIDILCLYLAIFHRLGAGYADTEDEENYPTDEMRDKRVGIISGMCIALLEKFKEKYHFLQKLGINTLKPAFIEFFDWAEQFETICDFGNKINIKYSDGEIEDIKIEGDNTIQYNFIARQFR